LHLHKLSDDLLRLGLDGKYGAAVTDPLHDFVLPVTHQRGRTDHHHFLGGRFAAAEALVKQRPQQRNTHQCLPQPHVVCKDTAVAIEGAPTHSTVEQKLHTLPLVRPELARQFRNHLYFVRCTAGRPGSRTFSGRSTRICFGFHSGPRTRLLLCLMLMLRLSDFLLPEHQGVIWRQRGTARQFLLITILLRGRLHPTETPWQN